MTIDVIYFSRVLNEEFSAAFGSFTEHPTIIYQEMEDWIRSRAITLGLEARQEYIKILEKNNTVSRCE